MTISPGARLGPYEVTGQIGVGGMGEVYHATDTNLKRAVAIKILPESVAADADRLARFQREAEVLASLNHPNIAAIYGLERSSGMTALVMELVDGPTLADRIARGAIPLDEALPIAKQIAEALEAAHERGIIHRDLKPANIKVRADGTVKVLDFGLAKAMEPAGVVTASNSMSPTITTPAMTQVGVILGTAAYMSPEQARGKTVDRRADIWAFGAVLFEMLSGSRAFPGADITDTLAAVVRVEPEWNRLPAATPPAIQTLLRRCLRKDPRQRLGDASAARIEIDDVLSGRSVVEPIAAPAPRIRTRMVAWAAAALLIAVVGLAGGVISLRRPATPQQTVRFFISPPADMTLPLVPDFLAASPDGSKLAIVATDASGKAQLWIRALDSTTALQIPGTDGASSPFWSANGDFIAFFADGKLKKLPVSGGPAVTLADVTMPNGPGAWSREGVVLFGQGTPSRIYRVPASGGKATQITNGESGDEAGDYYPHFLPDGRHYLYLERASNPENSAIYGASLDSTERKLVVHATSDVVYVSPGYLLTNHEGTLVAQPFDAGRLELTGEEIGIAEGLQFSSGRVAFTVSDHGLLAYRTSTSGTQARLVWVDRSGAEEMLSAPSRAYSYPRLSPDGQSVAVAQGGDVWVYNIPRGTFTRLTFEGRNIRSVWTPDGQHITFGSERAGAAQNIYWTASDGSGGTERLTSSPHMQVPEGWSPDGKTLAFSELRPNTNWDMWMLPFPERKPQLFLQTPFHDGGRAFSPNGGWLAYYSDESGKGEVYVRPFPGPGGRIQVSIGGGAEPAWSRNGREFFYRVGNRLMVADVTLAPTTISFGRPRILFEGPYLTNLPANYDVSPDGRRFLMLKSVETAQAVAATQINVVVNWLDDLKRRVRVTQ